MDIVSNLNECFRVDAHESAATEEEIKSLEMYSLIPVPDDYKDLARSMTEAEILVNGEKYIRIWSPSGCIEMNTEYHIQKYIPQSLAIGDDEGGKALVLMTGADGFGLYKVDFGDLCVEDAEFIATSLTDLLVKGHGRDNI